MPTPELQQWEEADAAFEQAFRDAKSHHPKHILNRWLGSERVPNLNEYRNHLLAGHYAGALPVPGSGYTTTHNAELVWGDFEGNVHVHFFAPVAIHTASARRSILKLIMDLEAGKISLIANDEENEESDPDTIAA